MVGNLPYQLPYRRRRIRADVEYIPQDHVLYQGGVFARVLAAGGNRHSRQETETIHGPSADTTCGPRCSRINEAGKKQVLSEEENAVKSARHASHVLVTARGSDRHCVENDADQSQYRHQIRLTDVLEVVVELANQRRVVGTIDAVQDHRAK